jgi:hypothetical protein
MSNSNSTSGKNDKQEQTSKPYSQERMPPITPEEQDAMVESSNTSPNSDRLNLVDDHRTRNQRDNISKGGVPPGGVPIEPQDDDQE